MKNDASVKFNGERVAALLNCFNACHDQNNFLSDSTLIELSAALEQVAIFLRQTDNRIVASYFVQTQSAVDRMIEARKEE